MEEAIEKRKNIGMEEERRNEGKGAVKREWRVKGRKERKGKGREKREVGNKGLRWREGR